MKHEYFTFDTLPSSLKMIGDNINQLRHSKIRAFVNAELNQCCQDGVRVELDVDEHDQLIASFHNDDTMLGESVVIRSDVLSDFVNTINNGYSIITTKKTTIMKKKTKASTSVAVVSNEVSNASSVSSERMPELNGIEFLVSFVSEHYAGSGRYHDVEKYLDVPWLFKERTNGAVVNIIMEDTNLTLMGVNNFSVTCPINGTDNAMLCEQVRFTLHTIIDYQKKIADMTDCTSLNTGSAETAVTEAPIRKIATTHTAHYMNSKRVVEKYNTAVYYRTADLEKDLKGRRSSSSSQTIRKRLSVLAVESGLKTKDMSGKSLVSELNQDNRDLLRELCSSAQCKVPSFLSEDSSNLKVRMRG